MTVGRFSVGAMFASSFLWCSNRALSLFALECSISALSRIILMVYNMNTNKEEFAMTFGERLNQTRKKSGKTAQEMADMLGIGLRSYRAYESGDREPYFSNLVKIADFLNVSTDYLLCRDEFLAKNAD